MDEENFRVLKAHESHLQRKCVESDEARGSSNVLYAPQIRREFSVYVHLLAESVYAVPLKYLGVEVVVVRCVLRVHVAGNIVHQL